MTLRRSWRPTVRFWRATTSRRAGAGLAQRASVSGEVAQGLHGYASAAGSVALDMLHRIRVVRYMFSCLTGSLGRVPEDRLGHHQPNLQTIHNNADRQDGTHSRRSSACPPAQRRVSGTTRGRGRRRRTTSCMRRSAATLHSTYASSRGRPCSAPSTASMWRTASRAASLISTHAVSTRAQPHERHTGADAGGAVVPVGVVGCARRREVRRRDVGLVRDDAQAHGELHGRLDRGPADLWGASAGRARARAGGAPPSPCVAWPS